MDIDSYGNIAFGQHSFDQDLIGTAQTKRGILVYVTSFGVVSWCKSFASNMNSGTFTASSVQNIDFSPSNLFIGVLLEIEEGGANIYTSFAIVEASDGALVAAISDYSTEQYYNGFQAGQILNLQDTLEMSVFAQTTDPIVGRVIPLAGTLMDYSLATLPGAISGTNVMKRASIVNGFDYDIYIGFGLITNGITYNNGIMRVDLLTVEITKFNIYTINLLQFQPVFLNQLDVVQYNGDDYIGACMSNSPTFTSIAFVLDKFNNFGLTMQNMHEIVPSSGSYDCLALHMLSYTQMVIFFELDGQGGFLIYDSSTPSSVTEKILTPLIETHTYFKQARMHSLNDIYFTGYTKLSEVEFGGAYNFPTYQAMLMKTDSTRTCLTIAETSQTLSITDTWPTSWSSVTTLLLAVVSVTHILDSNEIFLEDFVTIDFNGVCSSTATVIQPGIDDMLYYLTDSTLTQTFDAFTIDGEDLEMTYYLEMQDTSSVPGAITIDSNSQVISVYSTDSTQAGTYNLYLVGELPSGQLSKEPFSVDIEIISTGSSSSSSGGGSGSSSGSGSGSSGNTDSSETSNIYGASLVPSIRFPYSNQQIQLGKQSFYTFPLVSNPISFNLLDIRFYDLPQFISYQSGKFYFYPFSDKLVGNHTVKFEVGLIGYNKLMYQVYYMNVEVLPRPSFVSNPQTDINIYQNSQLTVSLPDVDARHPFSISVASDENNFVSIQDNELQIQTDHTDIGIYTATLLITDTIEDVSSLPYSIIINVRENYFEESNETNATNSSNVSNLTDDSWIPHNESLKQLTAKILSISETGLVQVEFSRQLSFNGSEQQFISDVNDSINCTTYAKFSNETMIEIESEFQAISYSNRLLSIQLSFEDPIYIQNNISANFYQEVSFLKQELFRTFDGELLDPDYATISKKIPNQLAKGLLSDILFYSKSYIKGAVTGIIAASALTSLLSSASMAYVISFVNLMQMVVHLPLICEQMPSNALYLFSMMMKISNFQYLPVERLESTFFNFTQNDSYNQLFEQAGYQTHAFIQNIDSLFYYIFALGMFTSSYFLFRMAFKTLWITKKINSMVTVSLYLAFINEVYIELVICPFINFFDLYNGNFTYIFNNFMMFACFFAVGAYPIYVVWKIFQLIKYVKKTQTKEEPKLKPLFGELIYWRFANLFVPLLFLLERWLFAFNCFFNKDVFYIQFFLFQQLFKVMFYVYNLPYDTAGRNQKEIFNELCTLSISYLMLLFTDFLPGKQQQYSVGWIVVAICLLNVVVNNGLIVWALVSDIKNYIRKKYYQMKRLNSVRRNKQYLLNVSRKLAKLQDEEVCPKKIKVEIVPLENPECKIDLYETKGVMLDSSNRGGDLSWKEVYKYERKRVEKPMSLIELNKFGNVNFKRPKVKKAHISEIKVKAGSYQESVTPKHSDVGNYVINNNVPQLERKSNVKLNSLRSSFLVNPYDEDNRLFDVGSSGN